MVSLIQSDSKRRSSTSATQVPCSRCNSSGQYSVGPSFLGQCFACGGKGFRWERPAQTSKSTRKLKPETIAKREFVDQLKRRLYKEVEQELNEQYGPFNLQDELDRELLNLAVMRATGKSIVLHRDERLDFILKSGANHKATD